MKVSEVMARPVCVATREQTVAEVARAMAQVGIGAVLVADDRRIVGIVTDRDIALRVVAEAKSVDTPVREIMTAEVECCFEDEDVEQVARNMEALRVRRLPVMSRDGRVLGVVSLSDIALQK